MEKSLFVLNEANVMKLYAMYKLSPEQKEKIDNETKGDMEWIIHNFNELEVTVHGKQIARGLLEFTTENICKILGGFEIALSKEIEFDDIPKYVINNFDNFQISMNNKGYYKNGNEIYFYKNK